MQIRFAYGFLMVACVVLLVPSPVQAAFPGGNGKIVFSSDRQAQFPSFLGREIFTMNPDGTGLVRLTNGTGTSYNDSDPTWSPDGKTIAFTRADTSGAGTGKFVYVMNGDGSGLTQVPNTGLNAEAPAWSPDGTRIVFANAPGTQCGDGRNECISGRYDLWTIRPDGTGLARLTTASGNDHEPSWSPDGTQIAFANDRLTGVSFLYKMNADGTGQVRITFGAGQTAGDFHPNWSPDGQRIVFHSDRVPHDGGSKIWVINADGANPTRVSHGFGVVDRVPVWSPDGRRLAFTSPLEPDGYRVYTANVDGTGRTRLTDHDGQYDFDADWQPAPLGNRPPSCAGATATPTELTPADRGLRLVAIGGAIDPDGDAVALSVTGVTQDEQLRGGEDKTTPDAFPGPNNRPNAVYLRAERRNGRDGRVYRVAFTASDIYGASCSGTAKVSVRRKVRAPAVDSSPPSYNSFGP